MIRTSRSPNSSHVHYKDALQILIPRKAIAGLAKDVADILKNSNVGALDNILYRLLAAKKIVKATKSVASQRFGTAKSNRKAALPSKRKKW